MAASNSTEIDYSAFSSNESDALRQFRSQHGRAPTASEVSAYRASQSAATAAAATTLASANIQPGFGGSPQWTAIQQNALDTTNYDAQRIPVGFADVPGTIVGQKLSDMSASLDKLTKANESMLKGEIPADVSASVRRAASENSIMRGVGGQAGRALSARDLGTTSVSIKQQGIENEEKIHEGRTSIAAAFENIRQFNLNRNTALSELAIKAKEQNLSAIDVERQRISTNVNANVNLIGTLATLVAQQQNIAVQAASNKVDPTNIIASMDKWLAAIAAKLS